jgi:hypothetical protein
VTRAGRWTLSLIALTSVGCSYVNRRPPRVPPDDSLAAAEWPDTKRDALNAALVKDFALADSLLRGFSARHPGTPLSAEAVYWRAFFRLDPAVESAAPAESIRAARAALDAYIAGGPTQPHYVESVVLRRMTWHLDSLHATVEAARAAATASAPASPTTISPAMRDSLKARDDELQRMRAELDQTKAELDRIRRRLAPPRP